MTRPGVNSRGRVIYSDSVLGNAARRVLNGDVDLEALPVIIARCYACNTVLGRCYSGRPECWHLAARMLLQQGARPLHRRNAGEVTETVTDEAVRRGLEALAEGLRRKHPGSIIEIIPDEDDADAVLDPPTPTADRDRDDHGAHGA